MEQPSQIPRDRVNAGDVRAFVQIATSAAQGEIIFGGAAAVLPGDDVVEDVPHPRRILRQEAVFASAKSAEPDLTVESVLHASGRGVPLLQ